MYSSNIDADLARHKAIHAALDAYKAAGLATCRIPPGAKNPISKFWSTTSVDDHDLFDSRDNIGILCGTISAPDGFALVCPDLDSLQAVGLADEHLPPTAMIEGRAGKPRSHRYYRVPVGTIPADEVAEGSDAALANVEAGRHPGSKKRAWRRPDGTLLLELLGTGQQAQAPPSMHPSGEVREWGGGIMGEPAIVAWPDLVAACESLAAACGWTPPPPRPGRADLPDWGDGHEIDTPADERVSRARAYLAKVPGTRAGGGARTGTFALAGRILYGFALDPDQAVDLLAEWGQRPDQLDETGGWYPWDRDQLEKLVYDQEAKGGHWQGRPAGYLLADHDPQWVAEPPADSPAGRIRARSLERPAAVEVEPAEGVEAEPAQPQHTQAQGNRVTKDMDVDRLARAYLADVAAGAVRDPIPLYHKGDWWEYLGDHWGIVPPDTVDARLRLWLAAKGVNPKTSLVNNLTGQLRAVVSEDHRRDMPFWRAGGQWADPAPAAVVAFQNGLVDVAQYLRDGRADLLPHTDRWFSSACLPYRYDPQAECPHWDAFLRQSLADPAQIDLWQEWCGYCLTADTSQQKFVLLYGPPASGKGTSLEVLTRLVGEDNAAAVSPRSLAGRFGLGQLVGKTVATAGEVHMDRADGQQLLQVVKSVTGGDYVPIERKHRDEFKGQLTTRFVLAANTLPRLADDSRAMIRRLLMIQFPHSFQDQADPGLRGRLLGELPGVANWALAGLARLHDRGKFVQPDFGTDAVNDFADLSSPITVWSADCCEIGPDCWEQTTWLYRAWEAWCSEQGHEPGSQVGFGAKLKSAIRGVRNMPKRVGGRDGRQVRAYYGITLGPEGVDSLGRFQSEARGRSRAGAATQPAEPQNGA